MNMFSRLSALVSLALAGTALAAPVPPPGTYVQGGVTADVGAVDLKRGDEPSGVPITGGSPHPSGPPPAINCALGSDELAVCGLDQTLGAVTNDVNSILSGLGLKRNDGTASV